MMKKVTILTLDETETLSYKLGTTIDTLDDIDNGKVSPEHMTNVMDELREIRKMFI